VIFSVFWILEILPRISFAPAMMGSAYQTPLALKSSTAFVSPASTSSS
jgi:hypothetical protein